MIFTKAFTFRLRPNRKQTHCFAQCAGAARWVCNTGLEQRKKLGQEEKRSLSLFDQHKEWVLLNKEENTTWLTDRHAQVLQQALPDLDEACKHFFRRIKSTQTPGYPHFRCTGKQDSFRYPPGGTVQQDSVWLPQMGWVRFRTSREIAGNRLLWVEKVPIGMCVVPARENNSKNPLASRKKRQGASMWE